MSSSPKEILTKFLKDRNAIINGVKSSAARLSRLIALADTTVSSLVETGYDYQTAWGIVAGSAQTSDIENSVIEDNKYQAQEAI